jgi:hypothetical protein
MLLNRRQKRKRAHVWEGFLVGLRFLQASIRVGRPVRELIQPPPHGLGPVIVQSYCWLTMPAVNSRAVDWEPEMAVAYRASLIIDQVPSLAIMTAGHDDLIHV